MFKHLKIDQLQRVAVVHIDRPPANALDPELVAEGRHVLEELAAAEPGAVVLTGREGFFSAGVDLKLVPELDPAGQRSMVAGVNELLGGWYGFPRPVVAAVNGHAIAGGLILALCGDYRIGGPHGKLGLTEAKVGIPYPAAAMAIVRAELSPAAARVLALRAELVDPPAAHALGLIDELRDGSDVLPRAIEIAEEMAELPASAYRTIKDQLRGGTLSAIRDAISQQSDPLLRGWLSSETAGAADAVLRG